MEISIPAAKYGGGILLVYIILALTFGYTMIVAETAPRTYDKEKPCRSFCNGKSKWLSFGGWINAIIPVLIVPYYSVIGGWVIKYLVEYIKGNSQGLATDGYFLTFISGCCEVSTEVCFVLPCLPWWSFMQACRTVWNEFPSLWCRSWSFLSVIIVIYSVTRPGALEGVKYFLVPNIKNFSWWQLLQRWDRCSILCQLQWVSW